MAAEKIVIPSVDSYPMLLRVVGHYGVVRTCGQHTVVEPDDEQSARWIITTLDRLGLAAE